MSLSYSPDPADGTSVVKSDSEYLIFYSSIDATNQMWCPDCKRVAGIVHQAFEASDAPSALIVFVGQREDWKGNEDNQFRKSPWNISSVPTVLKRDGTRLVDDEITEESLATFIKS